MRSYVLAAVALAAIVYPSSAVAADVVTAQDVARFAQVANAAWPASRCHDQLVPTLVAPADLAHVDAEGQLDGYADGMFDDSCRFRVATGLTQLRTCEVMVHEAGHLAGLTHDAGGVMQVGGGGWGPCVAAMRLELHYARAAVWGATSHSATCRRVGLQEATCRGRRGRRYQVQLSTDQVPMVRSLRAPVLSTT